MLICSPVVAVLGVFVVGLLKVMVIGLSGCVSCCASLYSCSMVRGCFCWMVSCARGFLDRRVVVSVSVLTVLNSSRCAVCPLRVRSMYGLPVSGRLRLGSPVWVSFDSLVVCSPRLMLYSFCCVVVSSLSCSLSLACPRAVLPLTIRPPSPVFCTV
jgi:hypothetical protein